jgi:type IV secretory pathway TraG/TraD family ATPase VirD4
LILLDEFPRLGKLEAIKGALATLRSKNVTICLMVQSLAQLDEIYGNNARRTIIDNCAYKAILGVTDADSQRYFSNLIGSCEIEKESRSVQYDPDDGIEEGRGSHWSKQREPIIFSHDLAKLKDVVLMTPEGFCRVNKLFAKIKKPVKNTSTETPRPYKHKGLKHYVLLPLKVTGILIVEILGTFIDILGDGINEIISLCKWIKKKKQAKAKSKTPPKRRIGD